jgi:hypothetical protein
MCVVANQRLTASANTLAVAAECIAEAAAKKAAGTISASDDGSMDGDDEGEDEDNGDWLDWSNEGAVIQWMQQQRRALRGSDISMELWTKQLDIWGDLCNKHGLVNASIYVWDSTLAPSFALANRQSDEPASIRAGAGPDECEPDDPASIRAGAGPGVTFRTREPSDPASTRAGGAIPADAL